VAGRREFDNRVTEAAAPAARPKPTKNRNIAKEIQPSSGISAIAPELSPQIMTPATISGLRRNGQDRRNHKIGFAGRTIEPSLSTRP
jgi:hypothetical protein